MDESTKIHPDAQRLIVTDEGKDVPVGWRYVYKGYFDYDAVEQDDKSINVYVTWADDQPGDMYSFETWQEVRSDLNRIISFVRTTNKLSGITDG